MRSGRKTVDDTLESERAEWQATYGGYEDPGFVAFVGTSHVCGTCGAVVAEMSKHVAWHEATS